MATLYHNMTNPQIVPQAKTNKSTLTSPSTRSPFVDGMRLSFMPATHQATFEQLFRSVVGDKIALSSDKAQEVLLCSKLSGEDFSGIWILSDTTKSGELLFPEFALAMYLCYLKLNGEASPASLPEHVKDEVSPMIEVLSFGAVEARPPTPPLTRKRASTPPPPRNSSPQPIRPGISVQRPKPASYKMRRWSDRSDSFKVDSEFMDFANDKIHLHKTNGVKIAVPIAKMSQEEVDCVQQITFPGDYSCEGYEALS
jgi:hypothetical protein